MPVDARPIEEETRAQKALDKLEVPDEQKFGVTIIRRAIEEPARQIVQNAGEEGSIVINKIREGKGNYGYNAASGEYGDLLDQGVIDPVKVVRSALQNAASVAGLMLTTEALVAEELIAQPGAIVAPGFGDLAEGLARPSSPI